MLLVKYDKSSGYAIGQMPRSKPKKRLDASSTEEVLNLVKRDRICEDLIARGCDRGNAERLMAGVNGAAVTAYHVMTQFPTIGEEVAWYKSVLGELQRFEDSKLNELFDEAGETDALAEFAVVVAKLNAMKTRYEARKDRFERLGKRGRPMGRSVLAVELVGLWRVHFNAHPKYPLPTKSGYVAPFLILLSEVIQLAEGLGSDDISIESLRVLTSEAIKADNKRLQQELQPST